MKNNASIPPLSFGIGDSHDQIVALKFCPGVYLEMSRDRTGILSYVFRRELGSANATALIGQLRPEELRVFIEKLKKLLPYEYSVGSENKD